MTKVKLNRNIKQKRKGGKNQRLQTNPCQSACCDAQQMPHKIKKACTASTMTMGKWDQNNERQTPSISYTWMSVILTKDLPTYPSGAFQEIKGSTPAISRTRGRKWHNSSKKTIWMLKIVNSKVMSLLFGLDSCCANYHSFSEGNSIKLSTSTNPL